MPRRQSKSVADLLAPGTASLISLLPLGNLCTAGSVAGVITIGCLSSGGGGYLPAVEQHKIDCGETLRLIAMHTISLEGGWLV